MAVTINQAPAVERAPKRNRTPYSPPPEKYEAYGRLHLDLGEIAALEQVSRAQVGQAMRRPDVKQAYEGGRAQTSMALRQKMITMALAGDSRLLVHAGEKFARLGKDAPPTPETYAPGQHSWDEQAEHTLKKLRQKYLPDADNADSA